MLSNIQLKSTLARHSTSRKLLENNFYPSLLVILLLKIALAFYIPILGDEAYFIKWGQHLDLGYYDHPPMIGWWLGFMLLFSDNMIWLRFPAILTPFIIGMIIYKTLTNNNVTSYKAALVTYVYLLLPASLFNVVMTTDTPLIFFSCLFYYFYYQSLECNKGYTQLGLVSGFMILSKYFSALLFFSAALHYIKYGKFNRLLVVTLLLTIPAIALHVYWNYYHCWANFNFNFGQRTSKFNFINFPIYCATLLFILFPIFLPLIKNIFKPSASHHQTTAKYFFFIPLLLFSFLSFFSVIGGHWLFSFIPFIFLFLGFVDNIVWKRILIITALYAIVHLVVFIMAISFPYTLFKGKISAIDSVYIDTMYWCQQFERIDPDAIIATTSYSKSAVLSYHCKKDVVVLGEGSKHGRADDFIVDFKKLDGRNVLLFAGEAEKVNKWFINTKEISINYKNDKVSIVLGEGLQYQAYLNEVLLSIKKSYYNKFSFLPQACTIAD